MLFCNSSVQLSLISFRNKNSCTDFIYIYNLSYRTVIIFFPSSFLTFPKISMTQSMSRPSSRTIVLILWIVSLARLAIKISYRFSLSTVLDWLFMGVGWEHYSASNKYFWRGRKCLAPLSRRRLRLYYSYIKIFVLLLLLSQQKVLLVQVVITKN